MTTNKKLVKYKIVDPFGHYIFSVNHVDIQGQLKFENLNFKIKEIDETHIWDSKNFK
jgi:hypothetical protein